MKDFHCRQCGSEKIKAVPMNVDDRLIICSLTHFVGGGVPLGMGMFFKMKCVECGYIQVEEHSLHDVFDIVAFDDIL
ncbi:MAG: hypothetical protein IJX65_06510 [Alistipes sp.]|nr:hypothetical protein [Alistipes sp.]